MREAELPHLVVSIWSLPVSVCRVSPAFMAYRARVVSDYLARFVYLSCRGVLQTCVE